METESKDERASAMSEIVAERPTDFVAVRVRDLRFEPVPATGVIVPASIKFPGVNVGVDVGSGGGETEPKPIITSNRRSTIEASAAVIPYDTPACIVQGYMLHTTIPPPHPDSLRCSFPSPNPPLFRVTDAPAVRVTVFVPAGRCVCVAAISVMF